VTNSSKWAAAVLRQNLSAMQNLGTYRKWSVPLVRTESTMLRMRFITLGAFASFIERAR